MARVIPIDKPKRELHIRFKYVKEMDFILTKKYKSEQWDGVELIDGFFHIYNKGLLIAYYNADDVLSVELHTITGNTEMKEAQISSE